ncbi:MAG: M23 family metallopeptidase [Desulfotalea sp.]
MRSRRRNKKKFSILGFLLIFITIVLIGGGIASYFLFFEKHSPIIELNSSDFLGKDSSISFNIKDTGNGIKSITITAEQDGLSKDIYSKAYPRTGFIGLIGPSKESQDIAFSPNKLGFKDGPLNISMMVQDFSCRNFLSGNKSIINKTVTIDTKAPKIRIIHADKYISSGGSGIAIYQVNDPKSISGVIINGKFNQGFLLENSKDNLFISYFAIPFHTKQLDELLVSARDLAGNVSRLNFDTNFKAKKIVKDRINISDGFLNRKIPEFEQNSTYEMQGNNVEKYVFINNQMRKDNNAKIASLCENSSADRMWQGRFKRMRGASPASFADHRSYYYDDKIIDKQVHLGMDLASTKHAPVKAANNGIVVFAEYLGIYGKMILLDHGQGLFSLYSHLSSFSVNVGDKVEQDHVLGKTGKTGMAGGDHLHFSMLAHGIFTDPIEWWDASWIKNNIDTPIAESIF